MLSSNIRLAATLFTCLVSIPGLYAQQNPTTMLYPYAATGNSIHKTQPVKKPRLGERRIEISTPVSTISGEQLNQYKGTDITSLITTLPQSHLSTSVRTTVNLRGLGSNRSLVLLDGKRNPVYGQSVTLDINSIPVEAIERVEVLKDGAGAVYGSEAVSGVVNFITRQDMASRIGSDNIYIPFYTPPTFNYSGFNNNEYNNWTNEVRGIYNLKLGESTQPDNTYGNGGSVKINLDLNGDFRVQRFSFFDPSGKLRQMSMNEWYPENYRFGENFYYDCSGRNLHYNSFLTDINGYQFDWKEESFRNGQSTGTYMDIWPGTGGNTLRLDLTPSIDLDNVLKNWKNYDAYTPSTDECKKSSGISCAPNSFSIGASLMLEDFGPGEKLAMPGGYLEYTRMFCGNFGATGHLSYNVGSENDVDYSKLSFLVGPSYSPFRGADCNDRISFNTQALFGFVSQGQKYAGNKNSETYFTARFGAQADFQVSDKTGVQLGGFYNPTFSNGNTSNNFDINLGVRFRF